MGKAIELLGKKFGRLTVIEKSGKDNFGQLKWLCLCDCGNIVSVTSGNLRNNHTQSCGCYNKERTSNYHKKHGMYGTRLYHIWSNMIQRCENTNSPRFKNYGEREISVCKKWRNSFNEFYRWSIDNGYSDELTIDRIDVNGNYEPSNCRWTTLDTQENNRTNNFYITIDGVTKTLSQWSRENNIRPGTAVQRILYYGWTPVRAVTVPVQKRRTKHDDKRDLFKDK